MRRFALRELLVVATVLLPFTGVGAQERSASHQFTVTMNNMNFGRMPAEVHVGDAIIWDNQDTVQHSVTARDGSFDLRLLPGKKGRTVLKKSGKLAIDCLYHPTMRTSLNVLPATK